jgi:metallo-beta-lactamase family protein
MAKLTFFGATEGVTGSLYLLQTGRTSILLECGLVQGRPEEEKANALPFPFDVSTLDTVVLSHAHLDHSGRLPRLVSEGFNGPVYTTAATLELLEIMLKDAAFLEMRDVEWENKRRRRAGREERQPLFTIDDVQRTLALCEGLPYARTVEIAEGVELTYRDAGHILGSAIVELSVNEAGKQRKLVFSGDLGNSFAALLRDPVQVTEADLVMMESTYGDRDHRSLEDTLAEFREVIVDAAETRGNILIPAFAVGRSQEIIFRLGELYQDGVLDHQAVFLDSPMAIAATEVYHRYQNIFNAEDRASLRAGKSGSLHNFLPVLRYTDTPEQSMAINKIREGAIIIAGSGMCNGGRIRHHLKHNLWRRDAHVLIVGYQAIGTPGRALVDGARKLRLAGEDVAVRAKIHTLGGFSAHASQAQLIKWISAFHGPGPRLYLVHGEPDAKKVLKNKLQSRGIDAHIAATAETIAL